MKRYEGAFQGTRGNWNGKSIELELKEGAKPFYGKPFRIPQAYKALVKKEVERLESIGLLTKVSGSEWAAPSVIIPKKDKKSFIIPKKDKTIRFLTDSRGLDRCLKRKPQLLLLIQEILNNLGAFTRVTTIDLNIGYYAMPLSIKSKKYCVISLRWGLYQYTMLPMGILVAADIFQEAMGGLFLNLESVIVYIDDIIILGNSSIEDHLKDVAEVLKRLNNKGMQVNSTKSSWSVSEVDYLCFTITRKGI